MQYEKFDNIPEETATEIVDGVTESISVEDALNRLGNNKHGLGKWQIWLFCIISASFWLYGFSGKSYEFMNKVPKRRMCQNELTAPGSGWTFDQARKISTPLKSDGVFDACRMYNLSYADLRSMSFEEAFEKLFDDGKPKSSATVGCSSWHFDDTDPNDMRQTVVTQWGLMCGEAWWLGFQFNMALVGGTIADIYGGPLVDIFGRKRVLLVSAQIWSILTLLQGLVTNWYLFCIIRAVKSASYAGSLYMLGSELMPDGFRKLYVSLSGIASAIGAACMSLPAYWLKDWRPLMIWSHAPFIFYYIYYAFYLPESPRWLVAMNREAEAREIILHAAKWNGVAFPTKFRLILNEAPDRVYARQHPFRKYWRDLIDTTKQKDMLFLTAVFVVVNNLYTVIGYGVGLLSVALPGNMFVVTALYSLTGIGSSFMSAGLLQWSRQKSIVLCMFSAALIFASYIIVPSTVTWMQSAVVLLASMILDAGGNCLSILMLEVYPVRVRTTMNKVVWISCLIGGIPAPYISTAVQQNESLMRPVILLYGFLCLVGAVIVALLVPDTQNRPMADALEEALQLQTRLKKFLGKHRAEKAQINVDTAAMSTGGDSK